MLAVFFLVSVVYAEPTIEDYATIEAYVDGVPVYAFGYTYIYGQSPDLLDGVIIQKDNANPITKLKLKKSWEIKSNYCGSTPAREPKTMWNDDQPLLPIHLIDGDPETAWSSRGMGVDGIQPEWIRIDLPAEATVSSVVLVCCQKGPWGPMKVGKALPGDLTVKLSTNGKDWDIVYENPHFIGSDSGATEVKFEPSRAKMIWVIGARLPRIGNWGRSFSIGQLEVRTPAGDNLALVSRGAGVQVSTTYLGYGMDRFTQDMLWPIQYDLGFKWTRVGYDIGLYLWSYVEREKGVLQVDAASDRAITEAANNGVNVIMCLDKGNWLYHDPPRKTDWKKSRIYEMMETYYDHQGWPNTSEKLIQGYSDYVAYMVRHFKGRVKYFEILNEWTHSMAPKDYVLFLDRIIPAIKKANPQARIMLGSAHPHRAELEEAEGVIVGLDKIKRSLKTQIEINGKRLPMGCGVVCDKVINASAGTDRTRRAIYTCPPWKDLPAKVGSGSRLTRISFPVAIPESDCYLNLYVGLRKEVEGKSDGFSVSIRVDDIVLGQVDYQKTDTGWFPLSIPLKAWKNQNITPELVIQAGPNDDPSYDQVLLGDIEVANSPLSGNPENLNTQPADWASSLANLIGGIERQVILDCLDSGNPKLATRIDAIGWHPWYQTDPDSPRYRNYRRDFQEFKRDCQTAGFQGEYIASEWSWMAPYPVSKESESPTHFPCTEQLKAKYSAQLMTAHAGLGIVSLYNETFQTGRIERDVTLLRNSSFQVDPITPAQPQAIYYVFRNISTILDGYEPEDFPVEFTSEKELDCYTFGKDNKSKMFAAWIPGRTIDGIVESKTDITLPGLRCKTAIVMDSFNGTKQELMIEHKGQDTLIRNMQIKDYPVFILTNITKR